MTNLPESAVPRTDVREDLSLATTIREREEMLLDPEVRRDPVKVGALLADEFMELATSGRVFSKSDVLLTLSQLAAEERRIEGFSVRSLGPGVALASYRAIRTDPAAGTQHVSWRSSVWKLLDGRWQIVFHHGTRVG